MIEPRVLILLFAVVVICAVVSLVWAKMRALRSMANELRKKLEAETERNLMLHLKLQDRLGWETNVSPPKTDVADLYKYLYKSRERFAKQKVQGAQRSPSAHRAFTKLEPSSGAAAKVEEIMRAAQVLRSLR